MWPRKLVFNRGSQRSLDFKPGLKLYGRLDYSFSHMYFSSWEIFIVNKYNIPLKVNWEVQVNNHKARQKFEKRQTNSHLLYYVMGFPGGSGGKEYACQGRRHRRRGFDPWVGNIPWRRKWQPALVLLPGNPMDQGAWPQSLGFQRVRDWVTEHTP